MDLFFPGLHHPADARLFKRACLSVNAVRGRIKPIECEEIILDSAAFTELEKYGEYRHGVEEFALEVWRLWTKRVIKFSIVVAQDYMCEQFMLAKTGLNVHAHQYLTIERFINLTAELNRLFNGPPPFPVMPVLQGYHPEEYVFHLAMYRDLIPFGAWVGVGSVCKRNGDPQAIVKVLSAIKAVRPDLRLHGFGIKKTSLKNPQVRALLYSADSMAWSYAARKQGRNQNDPQEAINFVKAIEELAV